MPSPPDNELQALRTAADGGDPEALFQHGATMVLQQRMDEAFDLYLRAAEGGHGNAQVELARMFLYGIPCEANPATAVQWLLRAEASGHPVACYYLALIALGGVALPRDHRINERMRIAIDAGYPPALRAGAIHFGRKPHPDDQALCLRLLQGAAANGDAIAAFLLAERLANGEGTPVDVTAATALRAQMPTHDMRLLPTISAGMPVQPPAAPRQLALDDALAPPPMTMLSEHPRIAMVDGLLSKDECRLLIATAQPGLRASHTVDPDTGLPIALPLRTSSDASLDPVLEDIALRVLQLRICAAAGIDLPQAEHLIVLRYEPGEQYRPHRDYLPPSRVEHDRPQAGNRVRTICVYLNDVEAGGETEFMLAGVRVAPKAGAALVFDNLKQDGSPDADSLHAGLPVERGVKWLATLWLRQGRYRDF